MKIDKLGAIEALCKMKNDIADMQNFKGKSDLLKPIEKDITFLSRYKASGRLANLFISERSKEFSNLSP